MYRDRIQPLKDVQPLLLYKMQCHCLPLWKEEETEGDSHPYEDLLGQILLFKFATRFKSYLRSFCHLDQYLTSQSKFMNLHSKNPS